MVATNILGKTSSFPGQMLFMMSKNSTIWLIAHWKYYAHDVAAKISSIPASSWHLQQNFGTRIIIIMNHQVNDIIVH